MAGGIRTAFLKGQPLIDNPIHIHVPLCEIAVFPKTAGMCLAKEHKM